ncbi:MAG TPA: hypothetical protein PLY56_04365 [Armatimonadota bacterium]|nr:hypothetical protein [Armatimonadota bacterium]HOM80877.1 hypothetical protein [Armatimonadota bacterium]HPO72321.1 hypothetical protein [Armatimonadota bacterium]
MLSPYDWNEAIRQRAEYIEERLAEGSPVVALSCREGILLATVRGTQRKLFEIYDRLAFAALGQQADIEALRLNAIDFAHAEGFARSPDDVTIGRVVAALSPAVKKAFGDPLAAPLVARSLFAEVGATPETDHFYALGYDGEFRAFRRLAVIAGSPTAEEQMRACLAEALGSGEIPSLREGRRHALRAWAAGWAARRSRGQKAEPAGEQDLDAVLGEALREGEVEMALLDRSTHRQCRFRVLREEETESERE